MFHYYACFMKTRLKYLWFFALFVLIVPGCKKDSNSSPQYLGWAVGLDHSSYGVIIHTIDGGKTWTRQGEEAVISNSSLTDVCILDDKTVLVVGSTNSAGNYTLLKTSDEGKTWNRIVSLVLRNLNYNGLFALNKTDIWLVGDSGSVYHSSNAGDSWTRHTLPLEYGSDDLLRVAASSSSDIWIVGDVDTSDQYPIMIHSTDGGNTWIKKNPLIDLGMTQTKLGHYLGVKTYGNSVWAIGGFGKFVIHSADNGATWRDISHNPGACDANDIILLNEQEAYLVTDYDGIYHTQDAGVTWNDYHFVMGNWYLGIAKIDNNIWITGSPGSGTAYSALIFSPDGGTTWQDQTPEFIKSNKSISMYKIRFIKKS